MDLKAVSTELKNLLEAHPILSGHSVVIDDGFKDDEMETALSENGTGFCLAISPPMTLSKKDRKGDKLYFDAQFAIRARWNVEVNKNIPAPLAYETVFESLIESILNYEPGKSNIRFEFPDEGEFLTPADEETGLIAWNFYIKAPCTLKKTVL